MRSASFPEADDIAAARCIGEARTARLYEAGVSATRPEQGRLPQIVGDPYVLSHVDGCGASSDSSAEKSNRYSDTNCKNLGSTSLIMTASAPRPFGRSTSPAAPECAPAWSQRAGECARSRR